MSTMNVTTGRPMNSETKKVKLLSIRGIAVMSLLSALSLVLMMFEIPLWFAPSFYKIDFSEVPVLIGAFALGPLAGVVIELVKILLNLLVEGSDSALVGEVANFLLGCSLVVPAAFLYRKRSNRKAAILGLTIGTIVFVVVGCLLNAYLLLPTYAAIYHMEIKDLVAMGTAINKNITNLSTFVFFAVLPFNLLKGVVVSTITVLLYKHVSPVIKGYHR